MWLNDLLKHFFMDHALIYLCDVLTMNNKKNKSGIFPTMASVENIFIW